MLAVLALNGASAKACSEPQRTPGSVWCNPKKRLKLSADPPFFSLVVSSSKQAERGNFVAAETFARLRARLRPGALPGNPKVLCVDPSASGRRRFKQIADREDWELHFAVDAHHAFDVCLQYTFDVIVLVATTQSATQVCSALRASQQSAGLVMAFGPRQSRLQEAPLDPGIVGSVSRVWRDSDVLDAVERGIRWARAALVQLRNERAGFSNPKRILVVGSYEVRTSMQSYVNELVQPTEVVHVVSLAAAKAELTQSEYQLAFTQLALPDACGLDSLSTLKRLVPELPVVIVCDAAQPTLLSQAIAMGAQDVIDVLQLSSAYLLKALLIGAQRRDGERRLLRLAMKDELTELQNRYSFNQSLCKAAARAKRNGTGLALLYVDLDRFKPINDQHGHHVGDEVLVQVAGRLCQAVREYDSVARLGGDEFAILLEDVTSEEQAEVVAKRVVSAVCEEMHALGTRLSVGCSVGISVYRGGKLDARQLLAHADVAMYDSKRAGGGTVSAHHGHLRLVHTD